MCNYVSVSRVTRNDFEDEDVNRVLDLLGFRPRDFVTSFLAVVAALVETEIGL